MAFASLRRKVASVGKVVAHAKERGLESVNDAFEWWGGIAYDHSWKCIIATLISCALLCLGFLPGVPKWVDGADELYALPYSTARSQGAVRQALFNDTNSRPTFVLVTGKTPGENILTWEHIEAAQELDKLVRGKTVDPKFGRRIAIPRKPEYPSNRASDNGGNENAAAQPGNGNGRNRTTSLPTVPTLGSSLNHSSEEYADLIGAFNNASSSRQQQHEEEQQRDDILTFQDICVWGPFNDCAVTSAVELQLPAYREFGLLGSDDPPVVWLFDGLAFNMDKRALPPHYLLGNAKEVPCTPELPRTLVELVLPPERILPGSTDATVKAQITCIYEAEGFQFIYEVYNSKAAEQRNLAWEKAFIDVLTDNMEFGPLKVTFSAFRSRDDALRSSTSESSDVLFVVLMFGLLLVYSSLSNFSCNLYRCKSYSAVCGIFAALLGMIGGMGLMSLCGIAFVPTALVCPFLVVGVGIDDMFVIINSYCLAYMVEDTRLRCKLCLRDTGLSITITTITSLVSFSIGLNTGYMSIKNFCWFCGTGMLLGYIAVLTFFVPVVCLDARRESARQLWFGGLQAPARSKSAALDNKQQRAAMTTFTLGALMCRRAEHGALYRVSVRRNECEAQSPLRSVRATDVADTPAGKQQPVLRAEFVGSRRPGLFGAIMYQWKRFAFYCRDKADQRLARVALEAHKAALEMPIEPIPSCGAIVLPDLPHAQMTGDPMKDIKHHPHVPLYYTSLNTGRKCLYLDEPSGNVGKRWRQALIRGFGPVLVHPWFKIGTMAAFVLFIVVSIVGCSQLKSGLDLRDLAPVNGYLHKYDVMAKDYFFNYDFPVEVFFPDELNWWEPSVQNSLRELQKVIEVSGSGKMVTNPFIRMLDDPELAPLLQSGNKELFEDTLFYALSLENGKYKQFEQNFVWEGTKLRAWKMQILPGAMDSSAERAKWMKQVRADCEGHGNKPRGFTVMAWNYMMTFYESDLTINSSVVSNMIVAACVMLLVAMVGLPQMLAGLCVVLIMGMIDVGIIGFMYFWGVKLNMVSMICLLISVGFCVDFSAHVCHTYFDAEGTTRDQRAIECVVLMGGPVIHGAATSLLGVLMLAFSQSYIFRVFFKMLTLVMGFALAHSVLMLPIFLTLVDHPWPHWLRHQQHHGKEHDARGGHKQHSAAAIQQHRQQAGRHHNSQLGLPSTDATTVSLPKSTGDSFHSPRRDAETATRPQRELRVERDKQAPPPELRLANIMRNAKRGQRSGGVRNWEAMRTGGAGTGHHHRLNRREGERAAAGVSGSLTPAAGDEDWENCTGAGGSQSEDVIDVGGSPYSLCSPSVAGEVVELRSPMRSPIRLRKERAGRRS